jgi:transcriptional regulator with XRE-family HTH domain
MDRSTDGSMAISPRGFGAILSQRRKARRLSQLDLSLEAEISSRHLSFLETGRARPSREMVLRLSAALDMAPQEQNELLLASGFAPLYRETPLEAPEMGGMIAALRVILGSHDPYGAVALDRNWDIVMASDAYSASVNLCRLPAMGDGAVVDPIVPLQLTRPPRPNMLRLLCHPEGFREHLVNWEAVTQAVLARVQREVLHDRPGDIRRRTLYAEMLAYPGVPAPLRDVAGSGFPPLVVPVEVKRRDGGALRFLSTMATLGTAEDITLRELRIEAFYPADAATLAALGGVMASGAIGATPASPALPG